MLQCRAAGPSQRNHAPLIRSTSPSNIVAAVKDIKMRGLMPLRSHGNIIGSIDLPCLSRAVCNIGCMIYFYIGSLDADGAISHVSFNPATSAIEIRELASAPKPGFLHLSDD